MTKYRSVGVLEAMGIEVDKGIQLSPDAHSVHEAMEAVSNEGSGDQTPTLTFKDVYQAHMSNPNLGIWEAVTNGYIKIGLPTISDDRFPGEFRDEADPYLDRLVRRAIGQPRIQTAEDRVREINPI